MLTGAELGTFIDSRLRESAFRLETLTSYDASSDGEDFAAYLRGEPGPDPERKQPWLTRLHRYRAAGIRVCRVHVLRTPLSPYLRYECEWGYAVNTAAGEDIGILDVTTQPWPSAVVDHDFWLIDDTFVLRMHYNTSGQLLHGELLDDAELPAYQRARDIATQLAEPFEQWWAKHPEEWRQRAA